MNEQLFLLPSQNPKYPVAHMSHKGYVREKNEDRLSVKEFVTNEEKPLAVLLAVLSDGVGGHQAGEIAAQIGVETVMEAIARCVTLDHPTRLLEEAMHQANQAVFSRASQNPENAGMSATCVAVLLIENQLFAANLGDSRAYLIQDHALTQLTYDHTWLEEAAGYDLPGLQDISRDHPLAHVLNRYLGSPHPTEVDTRLRLNSSKRGQEVEGNQGVFLGSRDRVLLCSDGLTDMLADSQVLELVCEDTLDDAASALMDAALRKGGHDNISIILIQIPETLAN